MRYEKYKQTGIPWLPEAPETWEVKKVRQFCTEGKSRNKGNVESNVLSLSYGRIIRKQDIYSGLVPTDFSTYQIVEDGYVVLRLTDLQNDHKSLRCGLVHERGIITSAYVSLVPKGIFPSFLHKILHAWDVFKVFYSMGGGLRQSLNFAELSNIKILVPPLPEQHAIVAYLDDKCRKIDELVAAKEKEVELLKELKQRVIADAVTGGCKCGMKNEECRTRPSGIPWLSQIPEGWEVKRLGSYFTDEVHANKEFKFRRAFKFNYGRLVHKNEVGEPEEYRDVYVKYSVLQEGDIVINGLNLNYDFISQRVAESPSDGIITSAYVVCRPRPGVFSRYFTYLFKAMDFKKMFHGMGTGIRLTLSFSELKKQMLPIPPIDEQRTIVAFIEEKTAKIGQAVEELTQQVAALKEYKQRLIADVVTGQMRIA